LIVSNPPYVAEAEMAALEPELRYEPRAALTPGGDGLDAYRAIARGLRGHLVPGGRVLLEIGPAQGAAVSGLLVEAGLTGVGVHPDLDGRDRVVSATGPS
ncbi:MAG: peptide chain release factor N(5)-glutamine methyltransferase, partial [Rhodobacteraceae bacterium]|nr:peptide chain release factor N(5)-glutamine methyltransferase [Paracoccaceae bacterium]